MSAIRRDPYDDLLRDVVKLEQARLRRQRRRRRPLSWDVTQAVAVMVMGVLGYEAVMAWRLGTPAGGAGACLLGQVAVIALVVAGLAGRGRRDG